ncbi:MAG: hypothetical protein Q8910_14255 [Bacteroidota bacterium]|nr:hypothetical protein [Bacteroidota bacterium]
MKNKNISALLLLSILFASTGICTKGQGISKEACFDQQGNYVGCGQPFVAYKDGVKYNCVCNCDGSDRCTPASSSSSSGSYRSGSDNVKEMVAGAVINGLFSALEKLLNSPPKQKNTHAQEAEDARKREEYKKQIAEQVNRAADEYTKQVKGKFEDQKQATLNDFKTRLVKSEAVKTIKQLNCAAFKSTEAAKINCTNIEFNKPEGPMEQTRSTADFSSGLPSDCPEVKIIIPDVVPEHPVGFQQSFYQAIKFKADSINNHVTLLKETGRSLQKKIKANEAVVNKYKSETKPDNTHDDLLGEAMKALEESKEEQKNITEEINACEKRVELYETLRSNYDVNKNDKTVSGNEN